MYIKSEFEDIEGMMIKGALDSNLVDYESLEPELFTDLDAPSLRDLRDTRP